MAASLFPYAHGSSFRPASRVLLAMLASIIAACGSAEPTPVCGDQTCDPGESHETCPDDCLCGDGTCEADEDEGTCPEDCFCGNGTCEADEDSATCNTDCHCPDGVCSQSENRSTCPDDCFCGNGSCDDGEEPESCPTDCHCPNGVCSQGEDIWTCPDDCFCGNGSCDAGEEPESCPLECGCGDGMCHPREVVLGCDSDCTCGDGACSPGEDGIGCPEDCTCGNGRCDPGEDSTACPDDCFCGDGVCDPGEDQHTCALDCAALALFASSGLGCVAIADGTVRCWSSSGEPEKLEALTSVEEVVVSDSDAIVRLSDGSVLIGCFPYPAADPQSCDLWRPALYTTGWTGLASGFNNAGAGGGGGLCAFSSTGHVACNLDLEPTEVTVSDPAAVAAASPHACALTGSGEVWCWGSNELGQLGDGTFEDRQEPVQVLGLSDVVSVSASSYSAGPYCYMAARTCAVKADGTVWCWGGSSSDNTGFPCDWTNGYNRNAQPSQVSGPSNVASISITTSSLVALDREGSVFDGDDSTPIALPAPATQVSGTCALLTHGTVWCWNYPEGLVEIGSW